MRVRTGIAFATLTALAMCAACALAACFDLFHSTSDVLTACEIDAAHPGCAAAKTETDFCAWTPDEAMRHARDACVWLGACEAPLGNNAFGPCYFRALMAYDCAANPDHRPREKARGLWDCLQQVKSCADVDACMFPDAPAPGCDDAGTYASCSETNKDVRRLCPADGGPSASSRRENCALWGQTCAPSEGRAICGGDSTGLYCTSRRGGCNDKTLHWCVPDDDGGPGVDRGIQCASNGAGNCGGFPGAPPQWVACLPNVDAAASCTPSTSATCDGGRATTCPSGVVESLDCKALLKNESACSEGALSPPFDWTSPCAIPSSACAGDSCDGGWLTSCERGANFELDCRAQGFGDCRLLPAEPGGLARAACTPPP